jgi:putative nucleotidyltransferase with HDIG domain
MQALNVERRTSNVEPSTLNLLRTRYTRIPDTADKRDVKLPSFSRDEALTLMTEWTQSESLRRHMLAVEAAMRAYARRFGEDEETWGRAGLLHDFDYERHPSVEEHPRVGTSHLEKLGYPSEVVYAIRTHAGYLGLPRRSLMDKTLFAVDELTGFITAAALVRPDKSLAGLESKSVRKRMKDKAFARQVNREDIVEGAQLLGIDLDDHIAFVIEAMRGIAPELGLAGDSVGPDGQIAAP